ncbi:MAG: 5,10-methylenetetrahydromethanopterin reductase [Methanosphaera sp.]|nr:5,10-methylenetetrahydromethanopterin reductase [Methanosphaera sp.]
MKFSLELLPNESIDDIVNLSKIAEDVGFENIWITDHYNNKDVFSVLSIVAHETSTINMGSGVSNPYLRNPVTIAAASSTLDEISNGRALVGVGPGDKATMEILNLPWKKPVETVKGAIESIRTLLNGGSIDNGAALSGTSKVQDNIPIYMAAQGPKMLEASGTVADGTLINASNPKDFEIAVPLIKKGQSNSKISQKNFSYASYTACSIDENMDKAYNNAKIVVAYIIAGAPEIVLNRHNISVEKAQIIKDAINNHDFKKVASLMDNDMVNAFSVCGNPDSITEKISQLESLGVNEFVVGSPIGKNKQDSLRLLGDIISTF